MAWKLGPNGPKNNISDAAVLDSAVRKLWTINRDGALSLEVSAQQDGSQKEEEEGEEGGWGG